MYRLRDLSNARGHTQRFQKFLFIERRRNSFGNGRAEIRTVFVSGMPCASGHALKINARCFCGLLHDISNPEQDAILADSVGLALLIVLDRLDPAERVALVLHDLFGLSFEEIATIVDRSPEATRQLASRARRRVQGVGLRPARR